MQVALTVALLWELVIEQFVDALPTIPPTVALTKSVSPVAVIVPETVQLMILPSERPARAAI